MVLVKINLAHLLLHTNYFVLTTAFNPNATSP